MNIRVKTFELNENQKQRTNDLRACYSDLFDIIEKLCKPGRETSLFWAIKGISRE